MQRAESVHESLMYERFSDDIVLDDILGVEELEAFDYGDFVGS